MSRALTAYRNGLRATRVAFNGDMRMLVAARQEMRQGMINPPNPALSADEQIKLLEDIAVFLRQNVVQGQKTEDDKYHLNIHRDTELGDNETIKVAKKTLAAQGGGCCGGGSGLYK